MAVAKPRPRENRTFDAAISNVVKKTGVMVLAVPAEGPPVNQLIEQYCVGTTKLLGKRVAGPSGEACDLVKG